MTEQTIEVTDPTLDSAWSKGVDAPMTKEEAAHVWDKINEMASSFPDGQRILWLNDRLARELAKGKRCAVCGDYQNKECSTEC